MKITVSMTIVPVTAVLRSAAPIALRSVVPVALLLLALVFSQNGLAQPVSPDSDGNSPRLPVDGAWEYRLDPENRGLDEKWYASSSDATRSFDAAGTLQFPGTLDDAGIGAPPEVSSDSMTREVMLHLQRRHQYEGAAWYRREVTIPKNWKGTGSRLFLERVLWKSTLWIDGKEAGSRESLNTPHQYDLGSMLTPGKHVLVLRIDNSKQYDMSYREMAHAYTNETQIKWNGVVGEMYLEALPDASIASMQIFPQVEDHAADVMLELQSRFSTPVKARLQLSVFLGGALVQHRETELTLPPGQSRHEALISLGANAALWDEFHPHLYTLRAELIPRTGGVRAGKNDESMGQPRGLTAKKQVNFGLRELRTEKEKLFLNGRRLFLRGTLECSIFPLTGHPPTTKEGWLKVFTAAQAYGLNHLRFHSWCPPEAAFEVADSLGFYLQAELPLWVKNFGEDTATVRFMREEAGRMIEAYGNHPSFCFWSLGNELQGDFDILKSFLLELKKQDPRHLYTTTTFTFQEGHGAWPEPQDDFFVTQWTHKGWVRGQGIFNNRYPNFKTDYSAAIDSIPVPVITHEIGQYSVYPRLDEIEKHTGVLQPANFITVRNDLKRKGLLRYADAFTLASGKLSVLLYKEEIERALKTRDVSGFQLLDLHDFPGQGTALVGILDAFWDSKGLIDPVDFRNFCSPVVPLLRFPKAVYTQDEHFEAIAELSNYGPKELEGLQAEWTITQRDSTLDGEETVASGNASSLRSGSRETVIASGKLPVTSAPSGSLTSLGAIRASLAGVSNASKLKVAITVPGTDYRNEWSIWVYPETPGAGRSARKATPPVREDSVVFTRSADEALKLLAEGRRVLLNPDTAHLQGVDGRFTQVFWSPVHFPNQPGTMGLLCDPKHPALGDFPTDSHTNWQWWDLVMRSKSMIIDSLPPLEPVVRVIDNFFKNRKMALVLEATVGTGKLVICSADLATDLENRPVARQLRYSLLNYMRGAAFRPETALKEADIRRLID